MNKIHGKATIVGEINVDGEKLTGIFVEIPMEEIKNKGEYFLKKTVTIVEGEQ